MTVESLKVGEDKTLTRFNIRTTEQKTDKVKDDDPQGVRHGPATCRDDLQRAQADPRRPAPTADAKTPAGAVVDPVRGGPEVRRSLSTRPPSTARRRPHRWSSAEFAKVLDAGPRSTTRRSRFEIVATAASAEAGPTATDGPSR